MKSLFSLLFIGTITLAGCGSNTDAKPEENEDTPQPTPASIENSPAPVQVADSDKAESESLTEPIVLAQAEPGELPATVTITNQGEEGAEPDSTLPKFGAGNLWISGQANTLETPEGEQAAAGFKWVDPDEESSSANAQEGDSAFRWADESGATTTEPDAEIEGIENADADTQQAEVDRLSAEAKASAEALERLKLEQAESQAALDAAQAKADAEVSAARTEMEAELQALRDEQSRILAEIEKSNKLAEERAAANAKNQEELARLKNQAEKERLASEEAARKEIEASTMAKAKAQEELERVKAEAAKQQAVAEADAETARKQAEEIAMANAKAQEELDRMRAEAARQQAAAEAEIEAARKEAEAIAMAKATADAELEEARLETARLKAEEEEARQVAEAVAQEKEAMEVALNKAIAEQAEAEAVAEASTTSAVVAEIAADPEPTSSRPEPVGAIQLAKLDQSATLDGVRGIQLGSEAEIENLSGAKVELAAYFFDDKGNPLKDRDKLYRSSKGQVYVGKESVVPSGEFTLKDNLFIPYSQLDLASADTHDIQVELVLWEYSQGRDQRLAVAPRATFSHTPVAGVVQPAAVAKNLSGTWQQDDMLLTIIQQGDQVVINGLSVVPYSIVSEKWTFNDGVLRGSVINKRKLPPMTRVWEFNLSLSADGNALSGSFHRADKNGNYEFDSEPFVWRRLP